MINGFKKIDGSSASNKSMQWEFKRPLDFSSLSSRPKSSVFKTSYWPQGLNPLILYVKRFNEMEMEIK